MPVIQAASPSAELMFGVGLPLWDAHSPTKIFGPRAAVVVVVVRVHLESPG